MGNQRHSPLGRQRGGARRRGIPGKNGARSGNADAGQAPASAGVRMRLRCRTRAQTEGSGLPHPGHSRTPSGWTARFSPAWAPPSRVASQFRRKAVSVELTHARQS